MQQLLARRKFLSCSRVRKENCEKQALASNGTVSAFFFLNVQNTKCDEFSFTVFLFTAVIQFYVFRERRVPYVILLASTGLSLLSVLVKTQNCLILRTCAHLQVTPFAPQVVTLSKKTNKSLTVTALSGKSKPESYEEKKEANGRAHETNDRYSRDNNSFQRQRLSFLLTVPVYLTLSAYFSSM